MTTPHLEDWLEHGRRMREEQARNPPPVVVKLRAVAAQRRLLDLSLVNVL
jgi:hypothetical protein